MKLFIWEDVLDMGYGGSVVVVVAEHLEGALMMAQEEAGPKVKLGDPTHVFDAPAAYSYGVGGL
jgi:hypothetical protein